MERPSCLWASSGVDAARSALPATMPAAAMVDSVRNVRRFMVESCPPRCPRVRNVSCARRDGRFYRAQDSRLTITDHETHESTKHMKKDETHEKDEDVRSTQSSQNPQRSSSPRLPIVGI